jgi:hypothetical protein
MSRAPSAAPSAARCDGRWRSRADWSAPACAATRRPPRRDRRSGLAAGRLAERLGRRAHQPRLAHADGRQVQLHAEMRCDPEPPRMRDALAVDHQQIGLHLQRVESLHRGGDLAEGQEARDVGQVRYGNGLGFFDESEAGPFQHDDGGINLLRGIEARAGDVHAADEAWLLRQLVLGDHAQGEGALLLAQGREVSHPRASRPPSRRYCTASWPRNSRRGRRWRRARRRRAGRARARRPPRQAAAGSRDCRYSPGRPP